jgi:hypothetical protein
MASSAFGGVYTWNGNNGSLTSPNKDDIIFTPSSVDLTLYGYKTTNAANIWTTSGTGTITTAGLTDAVGTFGYDVGISGVNGIDSYHFIQFNPYAVFTNLGAITSIAITLQNNTPGGGSASWDIWDSNTAGKIGNSTSQPSASNLLATGSVAGTGTTTVTINLNAANGLSSLLPYLAVSGGDCDVLISKIVVTTTPEPATLVFSAIAGLALVSTKLYRRYSKKTA